jgi:type 1 glutamine amidotransferase
MRWLGRCGDGPKSGHWSVIMTNAAQRLLLVGGLTVEYHQFHIFAPIMSRLFEEAGFAVDTSDDLSVLEGGLEQYAGVVNYTTARDITDAQYASLLAFVRRGGGYIGVHCASDTFRNQPDSKRLLGGWFLEHPPQLDIVVEIADPAHPITGPLSSFMVFDELYTLDDDPTQYHLLARSPSHGLQPVAWTRDEGLGRVFYISIGHNAETYDNPIYRRFLQRGAQWAVGQDPTA